MNKNKFKFALIIFSISTISIASQNKDTYSLPKPDSGIQIVPLSKIDLPEAIKKEDSLKSEQQKKIGYAESDSQYPRKLLSMKYQAAYEIKEFKNNKDAFDTHLKKNISEIKLAFPYDGIKFLDPANVLGFAPIMSYKNGWTGVKEFFNDSKLGVCAYSFSNMALMHGGIQLSEENVNYDVNKKVTTIEIDGSQNSGFTYTVKWYDKTFSHELECANMNFDKDIKNNVLILANQIDKT